ncbi:MAG: MerR family transcriptional regulator [Actinobacteria bacterium]|jgi:effector-binding domain-containing protein|nr:MAG: MerR family transcriptional regulator [Actinomycetota bacterium]
MTTTKSGLFSIGEFSRVSKMSVKTLRFYDERGLLKPAHIDARSGYRYYSSAQLNEANLIRMLRSLELPLEDIQVFMRERDPVQRQALLDAQRKELQKKLEEYHSIVSSIERLIEGGGQDLGRQVSLKELTDQFILGVRFNTTYEKLGDAIGIAFGEIFALLGERGEFPAGPPLSIYYDEEWDESDIEMEVCLPVIRPMGGRERVRGRELPGGLAASTLHMGPYHEIAEAYQALDLWMKENGYNYTGPPREVYLVGPDQVDDDADLRTEVMFPVIPEVWGLGSGV